ncbi:DNA mismatch repair protein MutS [Flavobacterium glycines]|uniref:DNA mismatch repair protein MutS n=1 Tax=Flavobacterium glycines TaxID=551990 RepID=A0A1B9DGS7_9FLAO|nr:hypothetical protein [Flavobacterium glycines]OCB68922.1 hypothetical protein FBGL_15205 [Flavobacterium glycines]GEL11114.1 hypothetical protein FGL01_18530 [Flavobacterium glycines]SDJ28191.1 DNA mismatch repair protein MutS [Flavobacterium glycines]
MNNVQDLNIKKEILPIFDYSLNLFARKKILELLETPLLDEKRIIERQKIFRGFASNIKVLDNYSYTVLYLNEVHFFLNELKAEDLKNTKYHFFTSNKGEILFNNKIYQLILFFHRLELNYFSRLKLDVFPECYRSEINRIMSFLSYFDLRKYEYLLREKKLRKSHINEIKEKISYLILDNRIEVFWEDLFLFEAYLSINRAILVNKFTFPIFTQTEINLVDFYHPLIKNPVKNSLHTATNVIVLNGPNMSGKSTILKSISLCLYLGNLGFGIPASKGEIPIFANFSIGINRRDDILNGYSHFMLEVINLKNIVERASKGINCFAVLDELFSGTNVEDALEICKTTINGVSNYGSSLFFISTHIQELKNVLSDKVVTYYLDCDLIDDVPTFTYKLKKGWSDIKLGRILFDKAGLNSFFNSEVNNNES